MLRLEVCLVARHGRHKLKASLLLVHRWQRIRLLKAVDESQDGSMVFNASYLYCLHVSLTW